MFSQIFPKQERPSTGSGQGACWYPWCLEMCICSCVRVTYSLILHEASPAIWKDKALVFCTAQNMGVKQSLAGNQNRKVNALHFSDGRIKSVLCIPGPAASVSAGTCQKCKFPGPTPAPLNQSLWRWGPEICVLTSSPGNSDAG